MARLNPHPVNAPAVELRKRIRLIESASETPRGPAPQQAEGLSFEQIVEQYHPRVRELAYRLLGWRDEVDDVTQDVFLSAFRSGSTFRGEAQLWTWLMRITINACRTHRRKRLLRWRTLNDLLNRQWHFSATVSAPDSDEKQTRVREAIRLLPARDREVIVLYYLQDLEVKTIAQVLGISIGAVDVRLHRARQRLREPLSDLMEDQP